MAKTQKEIASGKNPRSGKECYKRYNLFFNPRRGLASSRRGLSSSRRGLLSSRRELKNLWIFLLVFFLGFECFLKGKLKFIYSIFLSDFGDSKRNR